MIHLFTVMGSGHLLANRLQLINYCFVNRSPAATASDLWVTVGGTVALEKSSDRERVTSSWIFVKNVHETELNKFNLFGRRFVLSTIGGNRLFDVCDAACLTPIVCVCVYVCVFCCQVSAHFLRGSVLGWLSNVCACVHARARSACPLFAQQLVIGIVIGASPSSSFYNIQVEATTTHFTSSPSILADCGKHQSWVMYKGQRSGGGVGEGGDPYPATSPPPLLQHNHR